MDAISALGHLDALRDFGLSKTAASFAGFARGAKNMLIGDPKRMISEFQQGRLFSRGGAIREAIQPQKMMEGGKVQWGGVMRNALDYGIPLMSVYGATQAPPDQQGSAVGTALGGAIGGMVGMPLGLLGQAGGQYLGAILGRTVGSSFDKKDPMQFDPTSNGASGIPLTR